MLILTVMTELVSMEMESYDGGGDNNSDEK